MSKGRIVTLSAAVRSLAAAFMALIVLCAQSAYACNATTPCKVTGGHYLVRPPAGWDGRSPLPLLLHLPGYQTPASDMMQDKEALAVFDELGILVVAAEARNLVWNLPAFGGRERNEFAYLNAVLDDVEHRFPVDRTRVLATGFSLGGSMVWYTACQGPKRFSAFAAISGAFWHPEPVECPNGPVHLFHIHGLDDDTVPVRGRRIRPGLHQGNAFNNLETMRRINGCPASAHRREQVTLPGGPEGVTCEIDNACTSRHNIRACFHSGGHYVAGNWYRAAWAFLEDSLRQHRSQ